MIMIVLVQSSNRTKIAAAKKESHNRYNRDRIEDVVVVEAKRNCATIENEHAQTQ